MKRSLSRDHLSLFYNTNHYDIKVKDVLNLVKKKLELANGIIEPVVESLNTSNTAQVE
jgi:hypothetical protein